MSLTKKAIFFFVLLNCIYVSQAQYDTLQNYPFLYKYRWDSVGVANDGVVCEVNDDLKLYRSYSHKEAAFYQHTDTPLRAVGIAWGIVLSTTEFSFCLSLYDADLKTKIGEIYSGHYSNYYYDWISDTNYHLLVLPGKTTYHDNFLGVSVTQIVLKYDFFNTPIEVNGDFYLGFYKIRNSNTVLGDFSSMRESHDAPYHIGNYPYKLRTDTGWVDDTLDRELPEFFLIIEPECRAVESITVTADSTGCIQASWDSLPWQDQWVARLSNPTSTQYDTINTTTHTYCNLNPGAHYDLSVQARCYRPGGHNWAEWSPVISFGEVGIPFVSSSNAKLEVSPNPASGSIKVESDEGMIQMIDLTGRVAMSCTVRKGQQTFDLTSLPRGIYLVRLITVQGTTSKRLILF